MSLLLPISITFMTLQYLALLMLIIISILFHNSPNVDFYYIIYLNNRNIYRIDFLSSVVILLTLNHSIISIRMLMILSIDLLSLQLSLESDLKARWWHYIPLAFLQKDQNLLFTMKLLL